jgi:hypothetical protein
MNQELEKLIDLTLADGILTEKEKTVLFRKAKELGVDEDELEIILDGKLHKLQQGNSSSTVKHGEVKKCPSCNANVNSFSSVCGDCGYEFRNIGANNSVKELSNRLDRVVIKCEAKSYEHMVGRGYGDEETAKQDDIAIKQKSVIKNFPIPQTREDLFEMLYFIHPKTKVGFSSDKNTSAWRNKFTEILNRAKVAYASDKKILSELERFETEHKISVLGRVVLFYNNLNGSARAMFALILIFILCGGGLGLYELFGKSEIKTEQNRLKQIESEILQDIKEKNFDDAELLLNQLEWTITEDREKNFLDDVIKHRDKYQDKRDFWENKKSELQILIEQNKNK